MNQAAEQEFRQFVAARQGALFRAALLLTGHREDAEDLLQTALAKVAQKWDSLKPFSSPDAYVRRVLYNQRVSWWRRSRSRHETSMADVMDREPRGDFASDSALRIALRRVLSELTVRQRAIVVLRFYEDLPESEVAEILGCTVGTVRSQTHRTLARLRASHPELASLREAA